MFGGSSRPTSQEPLVNVPFFCRCFKVDVLFIIRCVELSSEAAIKLQFSELYRNPLSHHEPVLPSTTSARAALTQAPRCTQRESGARHRSAGPVTCDDLNLWQLRPLRSERFETLATRHSLSPDPFSRLSEIHDLTQSHPSR